MPGYSDLLPQNVIVFLSATTSMGAGGCGFRVRGKNWGEVRVTGEGGRGGFAFDGGLYRPVRGGRRVVPYAPVPARESGAATEMNPPWMESVREESGYASP